MVLQNDLSEYFSLLNFANPNYLGTKNDFRKNFENAIIRGRDSEASDANKDVSEKKLKELGGLVNKFFIRRTNDLLSKYCKLASPYASRPGEVTYTFKSSASEIRASRVLWSLGLPTGPLSILHQVTRNQRSLAGQKLPAPESHQSPKEIVQSP